MAAAGTGIVLYAVVLGLLTEPQTESELRWRLYGDAFMSHEELYPPDASPTRVPLAREEHMRRLTGTLAAAGDEGVEGLVKSLSALQVSCHSYPENAGLLQKKYGKFLESLAAYTAFHRKNRGKPGVRKLIWICDAFRACGGLADRMKGVTYSLLLAMLSRRVLILDWRRALFGEHSFLQPNAIDWQLSEEEKAHVEAAMEYEYEGEEVEGDSLYVLHLFSILGGIGVDVSESDLEANMGEIQGDSEWVELETNLEPSALLNSTKIASSEWIMEGMQSLGLANLPPDDVDSLVGLALRYLFKFSAWLLAELGSARHVLGLTHRQYVGVHVRTGLAGSWLREDVAHPKLLRHRVQWDDTLACAHRSTAQLLPKAFIFLAADSSLVKFRTLVNGYRGQFRTLDNDILHLDRIKHFPESYEEVEKEEGVLSTWIDLILLAESYIMVRGDSGFSILAGDLCFIPRGRTIRGTQCQPLQTH